MHGVEPAVTYLDLIRNLKYLTLVTLVDIYRALSAYRRYFRYLLEWWISAICRHGFVLYSPANVRGCMSRALWANAAIIGLWRVWRFMLVMLLWVGAFNVSLAMHLCGFSHLSCVTYCISQISHVYCMRGWFSYRHLRYQDKSTAGYFNFWR